jgi:hypothetical protein
MGAKNPNDQYPIKGNRVVQFIKRPNIIMGDYRSRGISHS